MALSQSKDVKGVHIMHIVCVVSVVCVILGPHLVEEKMGETLGGTVGKNE